VKVARAQLILLRSAKRLGHDPHDLRAQRITDLFFQVSLFTSWDVLDIRACEAHSHADLTGSWTHSSSRWSQTERLGHEGFPRLT